MKTKTEVSGTAGEPTPLLRGRWLAAASHPATVVGAVVLVTLLLGWQFIVDASRAVPALDTAWYQWRVEYLMANDPGSLIAIQGAQGSLAGGYRVAETVVAAMMRIVGGVGDTTPTVVLSVLFRVLAAAAIAAFAWRHRRDRLLFYLILFVVPALFLLQRFFGFLDNFFTVALVAGVLLLMDRIRGNWVAAIAATGMLFLGGLSHPTTLAVFLLSMGAIAVWRLLRDRSIRAVLRSEVMPVLWSGAVASVAIAFTWIVGLWGVGSSFSEAAVPPPQPVDYFVDRSLNVLEGMFPLILIPVMLIGLVQLVIGVFRHREWFAEVTVAWTLPLAGMGGFLIGAAYPYFRFFNATLAPLVATAVGFAVLIGLAARVRGRPWSTLAPAATVVLVGVVLAFWWISALSAWGRPGGTWITPDVRQQMAAAETYLEEMPEGTRALFVGESLPEGVVPYGKYKEFANGVYAGIAGEQIDDTTLFFGSLEDLEAGRGSTAGDEQYDEMSAETAAEAVPALASERGNLVVFVPEVFNEPSDNPAYLESCADCRNLGDSGLWVVPGLSDTPVSEEAATAAGEAAAEARAFSQDPPGPLENLGDSLLATLGLILLFVVPGLLLYLAMGDRSWTEGVALVPLLSVTATAVIGILVVAVVRGPFTAVWGWTTWALATAGGGAAALLARRRGARATA